MQAPKTNFSKWARRVARRPFHVNAPVGKSVTNNVDVEIDDGGDTYDISNERCSVDITDIKINMRSEIE